MRIKIPASDIEASSVHGSLVAYVEIDSEQAREIMFAIAEQLPGPIWGKIVDEINEE